MTPILPPHRSIFAPFWVNCVHNYRGHYQTPKKS